jgi:hypothetical protein
MLHLFLGVARRGDIEESSMPHGAKAPPIQTSHRSSPSAPSPKDEVSPRPDADAIEARMDNDLGAEWPGNIDCVEKAVKRSRRKSQSR